MNKQKLYKPRQIAKLRLITNVSQTDNEQSNYQYILQMIKLGRLKVTEKYGTGSQRRRFLISDQEIQRFIDDEEK